MMEILVFVVLYVLIPIIVCLLVAFLFSCARALGFRIVFDKKRKKE